MRGEPKLLFGYPEQVAAWVAARIPHMHGRGFAGISDAIGIGNEETGRMYAGIVFHDHQPECQNVQISMASDSPLWATRGTIRALLHYPFVQLGCYMAWTLIPVGNERAIRINEKVGFERKSIVPHAYGPKKHAVIYQMRACDYARVFGVK